MHCRLVRQGADKERFNALAEELSQLSTKFSNNVLDATKAFRKLVTDKDVVAGLPPSALALAAQQARWLASIKTADLLAAAAESLYNKCVKSFVRR